MATIDDFKAMLAGGGARNNQFRVDLIFPAFVQGSALAGQASEFLVHRAGLPGSNIKPVNVNFRGRQLPLAGDRDSFTVWKVSVYNDTNFAMHSAMMSWCNQINNLRTNGGITAPTQYSADLLVHQLDRNGAELHRVKIIGAWPSVVSDIELDFAGGTEVESFIVDFSYLYWQDDAAVGGA